MPSPYSDKNSNSYPVLSPSDPLMDPILDRTLQKVHMGHPLAEFSLRALYLLEQYYSATHNELHVEVHSEILTRITT